MSDIIQYFFLANMVIVFILLIIAVYSSYKFTFYVRKHYPERARDFGCPIEGWWDSLKLSRALHKTHDIDDTKFIILKNKARKAQNLVVLALLPFPLFLLLVFTVGVLL
jgi:hypothetical protein